MSERIVEDFLSLTSIDAESYQERQVADQVVKLLNEIGIEAVEDNVANTIGGNAGNLYGVFEGDASRPPILLSAHLDTVGPGTGKKPVVRDQVIFSDKTTVLGADDIAGVVEIIEGIRRVKESGKTHRTVEILFTVAEEVYTKGAQAFDYGKIKAKEAYCFDLSGDVGTAARRAPSLISFNAKITGKASHAGFAPEDGINAIQAAAYAISNIKQGRVDEESTVNIGTISGGKATNIVSEACTVAGEIRSFSHSKALELLSQIIMGFENATGETGAKVDFSYEIHFKAYEVDEDEAVIRRFKEGCVHLGINPIVTQTLGGADNHQFNAHGIKGIVVSCGMENVHSTEEYVTIENLEKGAGLVEELITR